MNRHSLVLSLLLLAIVVLQAASSFGQQKPQYNRNRIREARFGNDEQQAFLQKAYDLDKTINAQIFGQELITQALRDKLVQYIEGYGQRTGEPVAMNLMGLPGIGKTAMVRLLQKTGIQFVHFDAQRYAGNGEINFNRQAFADELAMGLARIDITKPYVVVIEELDKLPELMAGVPGERTQTLIGTLNQILSEGKTDEGNRRTADLSNAFLLMTMNISPADITAFSKEVFGIEKDFYDFTIEDFEKFHNWVLSHDAAIPKLLARIFRSNTDSRLAPLSFLVRPLSRKAYRQISEQMAKNAIAKNTTGNNAGARLEVEITDQLIDFLAKQTTYAPSGARNTVMKSDMLVEQLINFAKRAIPADGDTRSLLLPRKITLDFDEATGSAKITVTPFTIVKNRELKALPSFELLVSFSKETGQYIQPEKTVRNVPAVDTGKKPKEDVILKKEIKAARFPPNSRAAKGLAKSVDSQLFGQEEFSKIVENEMNQYMVRPAGAAMPPLGVIFAGFPGIGKSEMIRLTGEFLEIPIIKINLQQYTSDSSDTVASLMTHITQEITTLKLQGKNKYILLFEELDKVYEFDPTNGKPVPRPVMSIIKDILNNGQTEVMVRGQSAGDNQKLTLDCRDAFVAITMNFAIDRFDFTADPRLTTIENVQAAWAQLSTRLADLKKVLSSMFGPDTVNRLITRINILKPLGAGDYKKVIKAQIDLVIEDRFYDDKGRDVGQISVETTPAYRQYLFNESVVPSEGARFTANISRGLLAADIEGLTKKIPRNSKFAGNPLTFILDYDPKTKTISGDISAGSRKKDQLPGVYSRVADLNFPPLGIVGQVPHERMVTTIHEFGHAFASLRQGIPFEHVVVVPPANGTGGYVKYRSQGQSAQELVGRIYAGLASRAMERVMLSPDPLKKESVLDITAGASSDILGVTKLFFDVVKEYGLDPFGGVMERMGVEGMSRYANFSDLPAETAEALGMVLKDMENTLVKDFLAAETREWYADKISRLARAGAMTERQYYELVGQNFPGDHWQRIDGDNTIFKLFKKQIQTPKVYSNESSWDKVNAAFRVEYVRSLKARLHNGSTENAAEPRMTPATKKPARGPAPSCKRLFSA